MTRRYVYHEVLTFVPNVHEKNFDMEDEGVELARASERFKGGKEAVSDVIDLGRAKVTGQYQMQVLKKTVLKELKLEVGDYVQFWRDSKNRVWIEKVTEK